MTDLALCSISGRVPVVTTRTEPAAVAGHVTMSNCLPSFDSIRNGTAAAGRMAPKRLTELIQRNLHRLVAEGVIELSTSNSVDTSPKAVSPAS